MTNRKFIWLLIFLSLLKAEKVLAQEIPMLKSVNITAQASYDQASQIFTYSYSVANDLYNTGKIRNIELDISKLINGEELSSDGFIIIVGKNFQGIPMTKRFEEEMALISSLMAGPIIPIGLKPPDNWRAGISLAQTATWSSREKLYHIMPGQLLRGFDLYSRGLPTIRSLKVHPDWILSVEGFVSEEDVEKSAKIKEEITFKGKTLGPTAPPADFKPADFLDSIINMKHEAFSLGWIRNKGIEQSLDAKLESAKKKLMAGNTNAAINILSALINEVEAQGCKTYEKRCPKGKHLTPEAYALLKFNVKYLVDNLR